MNFSNAKEGIKKIYSAGLLTLIGLILMLTSPVLLLLFNVSGSGNDIGGWVALVTMILGILGGVVLLIISFVIEIIGVRKASKDENGFKAALLFIVAGIALAVLGGIFRADTYPVPNSIIAILSEINSFAVIAFIIQSVRNIADRKNNGEMSRSGQKLLLIAMIIYGLIIVVRIIGFFPLLDQNIISIIVTLLSLCVTVLYLNYLKKALKMLDRK